MILFRQPLLRFGRAGVVPANFAALGVSPSPLANDAVLPADADTEWLWALLSPLPASGTTQVNDAGGYALVAPADGTWAQSYRGLTMPPSGSPTVYEATITTTVGDGSVTGSVAGTITLDDFTLSGDFATGALSQLSSGLTLDAFALSGFLGLAPGRIDTSPFKNWTGTLLPGVTIPRLTFLRLSDMTTVLQLTNQVTAGDGVLTVTNAAFTPGTTYLVVAASVDGTSLGAEIYTAT